jgi:hypothetical protein
MWIIKSVPNMFGLDTLLRAPRGATMRVLMHTIVDITDIIWSPKSARNMSHHLGMARTVIDSHHLMIVVDHHHLMVYIDILPHMIFDDTTQDMVMRQEDESLDMKTFLIRRLLPLAPPPQWPLPRHMPMDSDATSASNKATFHGNVPISYVRCARPRVTWHGNAQRQAPRSSTSTSSMHKSPRCHHLRTT